MRILYLEDDPNDVQLMRRYTNATAHDLIVANTIADAWDALEHKPDLILVDILIGHSREGYGFAHELRQQGINQPMVAVTALGTAQDRADCSAAGFDDILNKPFVITDLADLIKRYDGHL